MKGTLQLLRRIRQADEGVGRLEDASIDDRNMKLALLLLKSRLRFSPREKLTLALVLHHCGTSVSHLHKGVSIIRELGGDRSLGLLWTETLLEDRLRVLARRPQLYGTQYRFNRLTNQLELYPVSLKVPDSERIRRGVGPLASLPRTLPTSIFSRVPRSAKAVPPSER